MNRDAWKRYSAEGAWFYEVVAPGFKYNMTDIQAALGLLQLKRIEAMQKRRYEIVDRYHAAFGQISALQIPTAWANVQPAWHLYVLRLNLSQLCVNRAEFITELGERNIGTSVHFMPVHLHPFYREYQRMLSLPLNPAMTDRDVQDVIDAVIDITTRFAR